MLKLPTLSHLRHAFILAGISLVLLSLITGCDLTRQNAPSQEFHSTYVENANLGNDFRLKDHTGQVRTLTDFQGQVVLLFFGYTHCPDICPTTLARAAAAIKLLSPEQAKKVQVLFATIDPERDTPQLLSEYVPQFHPDFLGLYGSVAETKATAASFQLFYQKVQGEQPENYSMDHGTISYVYDRSGKLRLLVRHEIGVKDLASDLRLLISR